MKMKITLVTALTFFFLSCQSTKKLPVLPEHTLTVGTKNVSFADIKSKVQEVPIAYADPYGNGPQTAIGFPLSEVLKNFLGENWKEMEGMHFTARDGYKTSVPMSKILKYEPVLAFRYTDATLAFTANKKTKVPQVVELGPYYLVWNNIQHPEVKQNGYKDWPYQIIRIDSVKHVSQFVMTAPTQTKEEN